MAEQQPQQQRDQARQQAAKPATENAAGRATTEQGFQNPGSAPAPANMAAPTIGATVTYQGADGTKAVAKAEVLFIWPQRESADTPAGYLIDVALPNDQPGQPATIKTRVPPDPTGKREGSWRWG